MVKREVKKGAPGSGKGDIGTEECATAAPIPGFAFESSTVASNEIVTQYAACKSHGEWEKEK